MNGKTITHYQTNALITGALATLDSRFIEGAVKTLVQLGLSSLNKQFKKNTQDLPERIDEDRAFLKQPMIGGTMTIVDLTVPIGEDTISPPSVNQQLKLTSFHRGPGFWQASKVEMVLHTGSHVDFLKHVHPDGETAIDVPLERVFGDARVVEKKHDLAAQEYAAAISLRPADGVLYNNLGTSYILAGRYREEVNAFQKH